MTEAPAPARRFYERAYAAESGDGFVVMLDSRRLKTPRGGAFVAPSGALAEVCASEWGAQGEFITPASMPVSQLAFATLDWTAQNRGQLVDYVAGFGETDLCCHRAAAPAELAARQAEAWDPLVNWAASALGVSLPVVTGVIAASVDPNAMSALRAHAHGLDDFRLTALAQSVGLAGSVLIAFAFVGGAIDAERAFAAAALDNLWSQEKWGEDDEAQGRLDRQRREFGAIARFLEALP